MSSPTTCEASRNATSSPASEDGPTRSGSLDGQMTDLFGQALAHASHSAQPEKAQAKKMQHGTFGLRGSGSSASASLQRSLGSRLAQRLATAGSTMFSYRLSNPATPAGRQYFQLAASGRRLSGNDCTWWPSPTTPSGGQTVPEGTTPEGMTPDGRKVQVTLKDVAQLAAWATPKSTDAKGDPYETTENRRTELRKQVYQSSWATPTTRDHKDGDCSEQIENGTVPISALLGRQVQLTASGPTPNGSPVETGKAGQLNPELPRWLMGFPTEWSSCADTAMQSMPSRRGISSKHSAK